MYIVCWKFEQYSMDECELIVGFELKYTCLVLFTIFLLMDSILGRYYNKLFNV